ncbi:MAG: 50S ribosomal protein L13 [Clostridiales bacterium]|jgi:large subunit ribosomal protein L13|nr:50S ribosomal protein L13 [Clostridiales bacterium]
MRTTTITKPAEVVRAWYVVDAEGKTLGRLATEVAKVLRGKHKPTFQPHVDTGDHVVVINADKFVLTGKKMEQKEYFRHSGYIGGVTMTPIKVMMAKKPTEVFTRAVKGMLPKTVLGRKMFKRLHVYAGPEHKNHAQMPTPLEFDSKGIKR